MEIRIYKKRSLLKTRNEWRWRLIVPNVFGEDELVANGTEGYFNKAEMLEEIDEIKRHIGDAPIIEVDR